MKNMKLNIVLAALMFGATTQQAYSSDTTNLHKEVHNFVQENTHHFKDLSASGIDALKHALTSMVDKASAEEKKLYTTIITSLNKINSKQLTSIINNFKVVLNSLKEVNIAAYTVIKNNLPKMTVMILKLT